MKSSHLALLLSSTFISTALAGCIVEDPELATVGDDAMTFEEFLASAYQEPDTGIYIVDGDLPLVGEEALRDYFETLAIGQHLIVHQANGGDSKWTDSQKSNLTYCVSTSFGSNYNTIVSAMANAAADWEFAADVDFVHNTSQDGNCTASNGNLVFDVRPVSGAPYLARAFFPDYGRSSRNILIDSSAINGSGVWSLTGILRHELGHALGFRHEHTRPNSGQCFEDNSYRELTEYDAASVMHYPHCNGSQSGDLVITPDDEHGAIALYGPARLHAIRAANGTHHVVAEGGGGGAANANRTAIGPWEKFHVNHLGNGEYAIRSFNGHYLVAESSGAANANRGAIGSFERFEKIDAGNGQVAFRSVAHNRYMVAEGAGGGALNANRTAIGAWEKFTLVALAPDCGSEQVSFIGGPYANQHNGVFTITRYYNGYPVYQRNGWSLYRRDNGRWHLDFNAVSEDWDGTVAYTTSAASVPWGAPWNSGAASTVATLELSGGPYTSLTNGTYTLTGAYGGEALYQRNGWSLYRRNNGAWHLDFNAVSEDWDGTVAYTTNSSLTPWQGTWNGNLTIALSCSY